MIQTDTNEDHPGVPGLLLNCFSPKCMLKSHRPVSLGEVIMEDDWCPSGRDYDRRQGETRKVGDCCWPHARPRQRTPLSVTGEHGCGNPEIGSVPLQVWDNRLLSSTPTLLSCFNTLGCKYPGSEQCVQKRLKKNHLSNLWSVNNNNKNPHEDGIKRGD